MRSLRHFYISLFIGQRFYFLLIGIVMLYVLAFFFSWMIWVAFGFGTLLVAAALVDIVLLYSIRDAITSDRVTPERLSNGDDNLILINASSHYSFPVDVKIIDELPVQFQVRNFSLKETLHPDKHVNLTYPVHPTRRGEYSFGDIHFFVRSKLRLLERRITIPEAKTIPCYPSYIQLKKFQLLAATDKLNEIGVKQVRRIGHSLEFEQIKEYVPGDDYRTINWKASSRRNNTLMVNNYTDERSQPVYCIINCGRVMKMPFGQLSLLDYAINASLVLSNIALTKQDKAGLITYGDKWINILPAERSKLQMNSILSSLYNLDTNFKESNIERLYHHIRTKVQHRSLLIYFTNYETISSLRRDVPYLRMLNKSHLLLVIFFENTELKSITSSKAHTVEDIYTKTIAEKFVYEKRLITKELQQYGIISILSTPQELTINTINKYLELKARQAI